MSGRIVPVGGLTYYDANMGRLVTEGPDVCDYKSRLREIDPTLNAYYDVEQEEWIGLVFHTWNRWRAGATSQYLHPAKGSWGSKESFPWPKGAEEQS